MVNFPISGGNPNPDVGTVVFVLMDEQGREAAHPDVWHARLVQQKGNSILVEFRSPCNCIIGEWNFCIETRRAGSEETYDEYENPTDINIILNPWCKCKRVPI